MPIAIVCPGCHSRFNVSDQYAGKQGPCPKCKKTITIPKLEEQVVIHAPTGEAGTKDKTGRPSLKPTAKTVTRFNPIIAVLAVGVTIGAFGVAFVLKSQAKAEQRAPLVAVVGGLAILGPLLVVAGYAFLRDEEFEPFRGKELYGRTALVAALYAALWGVFYLAYPYLVDLDVREPPEIYTWLFVGPPFVGAGMFIAWAFLQLEWGNAFLHFAFYLLVMMLLRITMGLNGAWEFVPPPLAPIPSAEQPATKG